MPTCVPTLSSCKIEKDQEIYELITRKDIINEIINEEEKITTLER